MDEKMILSPFLIKFSQQKQNKSLNLFGHIQNSTENTKDLYTVYKKGIPTWCTLLPIWLWTLLFYPYFGSKKMISIFTFSHVSNFLQFNYVFIFSKCIFFFTFTALTLTFNYYYIIFANEYLLSRSRLPTGSDHENLSKHDCTIVLPITETPTVPFHIFVLIILLC